MSNYNPPPDEGAPTRPMNPMPTNPQGGYQQPYQQGYPQQGYQQNPYPGAQPPKKGGALKWILIGCAGFLVIGMIVGLVSIRDQIVQELADVAGAISEVNQSFSFSAITGHNSSTAGSDFLDQTDNCDDPGEQLASGTPPVCVNVSVPDTEES